MIRNRELVSRAKVFARDVGIDRGNQINAMVEGYEAACQLSVGLDASRAKVWEAKASERRNTLANAIGFQNYRLESIAGPTMARPEATDTARQLRGGRQWIAEPSRHSPAWTT